MTCEHTYPAQSSQFPRAAPRFLCIRTRLQWELASGLADSDISCNYAILIYFDYMIHI